MKTYTPKQIAEEMFAETVTQQTEFTLASEARAEVERLTRERDEALEQRTEQRSLTDGLVADIKRLDREIEKLRAGNEKLREALKKIARRAPYVADFPWKIARDALEGGR